MAKIGYYPELQPVREIQTAQTQIENMQRFGAKSEIAQGLSNKAQKAAEAEAKKSMPRQNVAPGQKIGPRPA